MKEAAEFMSEHNVLLLGRLGDLNLGNPTGIPSSLQYATREELEVYGQGLLAAVVPVTDSHHFTCIDGRRCKSNADGSHVEHRRAQVGGTGAAVEIALNAASPLLDQQATLGHEIHVIEDALGVVKRSAHLGGCGGVNGAIADNRTIAEKDAIMAAVDAIMSVPEVHAFAGFDYNDQTALKIRHRAVNTAAWLEKNKWDGQVYVDGAYKESPDGVEDLETFDNGFSGHEEPALVLVLSTTRDKTVSPDETERLGMGRPFVANIDASLDVAIQLGSDDTEAIQAAFMANLAKHVAVADRLPSRETPVYLLIV